MLTFAAGVTYERPMATALKISAADFVPAHPKSLQQLREAAAGCKGCELYKKGTQTVFGEGIAAAKVVLVGEQPGDREDLAGKPFVGPAGRMLDKCLESAGIDRKQVYVTNAVKHFKWEPSGSRRLHKKPSAREVAACTPWLEQELKLVKPEVLVCLGSTAAQALLGKDFRVTKQRGVFLASAWSAKTIATVHPSSLLRAPDEQSRRQMIDAFVADLKVIRAAIG
jgi:uracil-DNA glycosylase family protein